MVTQAVLEASAEVFAVAVTTTLGYCVACLLRRFFQEQWAERCAWSLVVGFLSLFVMWVLEHNNFSYAHDRLFLGVLIFTLFAKIFWDYGVTEGKKLSEPQEDQQVEGKSSAIGWRTSNRR